MEAKKLLCLLGLISFLFRYSLAQEKFVTPVPIVLSERINNVNEEFSGMALSESRLFLLPQYGDALINGDSKEKDTVLNKQLKVYSYPISAIDFALNHQTSLGDPDIFYLRNLSHLPDSVKQAFEGFEAMTIANGTVFLSIETPENKDFCFLIKGHIDTLKKEIVIDTSKIITLKRPFFIKNAGFESLAYLPNKNKLLTIYEFNASYDTSFESNPGYLIDTSFEINPNPEYIPLFFFRLTDIYSDSSGYIYGLNTYWNGDYNNYLNNEIIKNTEETIKHDIPELKDSLTKNMDYLKQSTTCFARIIKLNMRTDTIWNHIISFEKTCTNNNWEGLVPFKKGVLVISDANRNKHLVTSLEYVEFKE